MADILSDCGARILFVENDEQLDKALEARPRCPALERIVIFDMNGLRDLADPICQSFEAFLARGAEHDAAHGGDWEAGIAAIAPDSLAVLAYTAGTTGPPKGVMLSHRNILFQVEHAARVFGEHPGDERLVFMPMAHAMERILGLYVAFHSGTVSNYVESVETVAENLQEVQPTILCTAPHVWARFHSRIVVANSGATFLQRTLYRWAIAAGSREAGARLAGRRAAPWTAAEAWLLRELVLNNVRRELGLNRLRLGLIGGAAVSAELIRWFMALGLDLVEIYGQTECAGLAAAGKPVPYGELAISPAGQVLLRGEHVFKGYWNRSETTARTLQGGWLHTGDLGCLERGRLRITGRTEDTITVAAGNAYAAAEIEKELKLSPYIADGVLFGERQAFLSCLVMLDQEAVEKWAHDNDVPFTSFASLVRSQPVRALIGREVEAANTRLGGPVAIRSFRLIEQRLEPGDPELTPMMKLKRGVVGETYRHLINEMYYGAAEAKASSAEPAREG
ncbi:MAG: AMP-binding protein [Pseudomonadota bacterium]|nr:AMP-binding protein [Pseudomonadota bacterium]